MIGGQGADSMEGGTGDDQIYGDGSEEIGGLPDGDLNHAGDDVIAGDVLNNGFEFSGGEGGPRQTRSEERRVGQECVSTGRSRWAPSHQNKNNKYHENKENQT